MDFRQYTDKEPKEVLKALQSRESGLGRKEVLERLKIYGPNEVKVREANFWEIFLRQFKSPFCYLLLIAAILAFLIGERVNGFLILGFVFLNVILGFFQEARAAKTAAILKRYIPFKGQSYQKQQTKRG